MFSAEIWNQIESQWGREIKKGCSRWRELQSRRLSYHQLIEWNPPTSFPSWLFSRTMLGSNLVVWNHKNSMWKTPCSWHAAVRNSHVQIHLQQGPALRQNFLSHMSELSPTDDPTGARPYPVVNTSIPRLLRTSWEVLLIPEGAGSWCRMGAESTIQGEAFVGVLGGSSCTVSLLWGHISVHGTLCMASSASYTSRGIREMQSANTNKAQHFARA